MLELNEVMGGYFILNGKSLAVSQLNEYLNPLLQSASAYEVIRVEESVPLFVEDYLDRLTNTLKALNFEHLFSKTDILKTIRQLILVNQHKSGPVKLMLSAGEEKIFIAYLMRPHLPSPDEYLNGANTVTLQASRTRPGVKVWNRQMREKSIKLLEKTGTYEALLVEANGMITEASRSNVFFVSGGQVYTTPVDLVLPGITRKKVIEVCQQLSIPVNYKTISVNDLSNYEACFLTGTARKIVPVNKIDDLRFSADNPILKKISDGFEELVAAYLVANNF